MFPDVRWSLKDTFNNVCGVRDR